MPWAVGCTKITAKSSSKLKNLIPKLAAQELRSERDGVAPDLSWHLRQGLKTYVTMPFETERKTSNSALGTDI